MKPVCIALPQLIWSHPGNRGRRLRATCRFLAWQAWERTAGRPWTVSLAGSRRLRCEPHSTSASAVLYCGLPDWPEMNLTLDYLRPGDVFIDVGANVGVYSLLASVVPEVEVWAFEPSSETFEKTSANIALNALDGRVHAVQAAVGAHDGTVMLTVGLDSVNHVTAATDEAAAEPVKMVALDSYLAAGDRTRVAMIKVDVEGAELAVLAGAQQLIRDSRPVLVIEANDVEGLASWLSEEGYRPFTYVPERRELAQAAWTAPPTGNLIAVADTALAQLRLRQVVLADDRRP